MEDYITVTRIKVLLTFQLKGKYYEIKKGCFRCLLIGHVQKNYSANYKCYSCQRKNSKTSISIQNKKDNKSQKPSVNCSKVNEGKVAMLIDSKTDLLLPTANYIVFLRGRKNFEYKSPIRPRFTIGILFIKS